jgi:hypothetical protein
VNDHAKAPSNPFGVLHYKKQIIQDLMPYFRAIRIVDWWANPFWIWTGKGNDVYGLRTSDDRDFVMASFGRKRVKEDWSYDADHPESGCYEVRDRKDFERDIVMWNGRFIRCPGGR